MDRFPAGGSAAGHPDLVGGRGYPILVAGSLVALVALLLVAVSIGAVTLPVDDIWHIITAHLRGEAGADPIDDGLVWGFRVPRVLLAAVVATRQSLNAAPPAAPGSVPTDPG